MNKYFWHTRSVFSNVVTTCLRLLPVSERTRRSLNVFQLDKNALYKPEYEHQCLRTVQYGIVIITR